MGAIIQAEIGGVSTTLIQARPAEIPVRSVSAYGDASAALIRWLPSHRDIPWSVCTFHYMTLLYSYIRLSFYRSLDIARSPIIQFFARVRTGDLCCRRGSSGGGKHGVVLGQDARGRHGRCLSGRRSSSLMLVAFARHGGTPLGPDLMSTIGKRLYSTNSVPTSPFVSVRPPACRFAHHTESNPTRY